MRQRATTRRRAAGGGRVRVHNARRRAIHHAIPAAKQLWEMTRAEYKAAMERQERERLVAMVPGYKPKPRRPSAVEKAGRRTEWDAMVDNWRRQEVEQAVAEGRAVPDEVLADYPELRVGNPSLDQQAAYDLVERSVLLASGRKTAMDDVSQRLLDTFMRRTPTFVAVAGEVATITEAIAGLDTKYHPRHLAEALQYASASVHPEPGREELVGPVEYLRFLVAHEGERDEHGRPAFFGAERAKQILGAMSRGNPGIAKRLGIEKAAYEHGYARQHELGMNETAAPEASDWIESHLDPQNLSEFYRAKKAYMQGARDAALEKYRTGQAENPGVVKRFPGGAHVKPPKRSDWPIGKALDEAYKAGLRYGDTGAFEDWLEKTGLAGRGSLLRSRLEREFRRAVEGEPERTVAYKGATISLLPDGDWSVSIEPGSRFDGLTEGKQFVDAALRGKNPIDIATILGVGVLAGAVQGVVEPYVTKHVYGVGSGHVGAVGNPELPDWIKTGTAAMLGTTHTTKPFASTAELRRAVAPYAHLGRWKVFKDERWSERAGKMLPGYVGLIWKAEAVGNPGLLRGPAAREAVRVLRAKGYTASLGSGATYGGRHVVYKIVSDAPDEVMRRLTWRLSATYRADQVPDTEEEFDQRFPVGNPATTYLGWPVVVIGSHRSWAKVKDRVGEDNLIELYTYDRQRSAGTGYAAIRPGKLSAALGVGAVSRASFRGKVSLHPGAEHTGRDPWPLVRKVVEEYQAAGGTDLPWSTPTQNPGGEYLIQVFGKGYLAGGQGVSPTRMHAPGIVDRYTDDLRQALRVSREQADELQRKYAGAFAAVLMEEALRAGPTREGNPTPGQESEYREATHLLKVARVELYRHRGELHNRDERAMPPEWHVRMKQLYEAERAAEARVARVKKPIVDEILREGKGNPTLDDPELERLSQNYASQGVDTRRVPGQIRKLKSKLADHRERLRSKGYADDGVARSMERDIQFRERALELHRAKGNPGTEPRFYVGLDTGKWPPSNKWAVWDHVTGERVGKRSYLKATDAEGAAGKLNRDWAAGKIKVIPEGTSENPKVPLVWPDWVDHEQINLVELLWKRGKKQEDHNIRTVTAGQVSKAAHAMFVSPVGIKNLDDTRLPLWLSPLEWSEHYSGEPLWSIIRKGSTHAA